MCAVKTFFCLEFEVKQCMFIIFIFVFEDGYYFLFVEEERVIQEVIVFFVESVIQEVIVFFINSLYYYVQSAPNIF